MVYWNGQPLSRHRTVCEISCEAGIYRLLMNRINHKNLHLKCFKKQHAQELSHVNCISLSVVAALKVPATCCQLLSFSEIFSDETMFTIASPVNLPNDCVYTCRAVQRSTTLLLMLTALSANVLLVIHGVHLCLKPGLH